MNKKCTWIGHGEGCQSNTVENRNYCEEHLWRIYVKGSQLYKRKKDIRTADNVRMWENIFNQAVEELEAEGWDPTTEINFDWEKHE